MITYASSKNRNSTRNNHDSDTQRLRDTKIERAIAKQFDTCPYREVRNVEIFFSDGLVHLQGVLSSFHLKQIAQTLVQRVAGVERIENCIEVATIGYFQDSARRLSCK